jgi:hypothetical protein
VGTTQDLAFKSFAESIVYSINDPLAQEQSMEAIMRAWSKSNPEAASNWLAGWNVTEEFKTRLQSSLASN